MGTPIVLTCLISLDPRRGMLSCHLMSATWLQGDENSKYPFLDPTKSNKLELWVFRSPNFGFKDASSLAAAGKNMMGHFYNEYFPQGMHKLPREDVLRTADTLEKAFSDD